MLMPKKIRYRKVQRGTRAGRSKGARDVTFGEYGLKAMEPGWITAQQMESIRVTLARHLKKLGRVYFRIFPDKPVSKKPAETRMGKGKGNVEFWVAVVKRERVLFEISGLSEQEAKEALRIAACKLPIKTRFVKRDVADQTSVTQEHGG
jgi:large subunit ribosomal protein L16